MRICSLLAAAALVLASLSAVRAQSTGLQFGAKAGLNMAILSGQFNTTAEFKPGLAIGAFLRWRPSERIALQPELVYSQQGTANVNSFLGVPAKSQVNLNYLNVPVLFKIYLGNLVNVQVGPQVGLLLSGRETGQVGYYSSGSSISLITVDEDVKSDYSSDISWCGGLGVDLKNGLLISARLNYGFTDINNNEADKAFRRYLSIGGLHNRAFEFALGYAFGSK